MGFRLVQRDVIGLVYHLVSEEAPDHVRNLYPFKAPREFEADVEYVKAHFPVVSYEEAAKARKGEGQLKPNSILFTVDDGFRECITEIAPILKRHNIPVVFFVCTDFLDNRHLSYRSKVSLCIEKAKGLHATQLETVRREMENAHREQKDFRLWLLSLSCDEEGLIDGVCERLGVNVTEYLDRRRPFLTSAEVQTLSRDRFVIGAHSTKHPDFRRLKPDEMEREIVESCRAVQKLTGQKEVPFAFPFDGAGVDRELLARLRKTYPFIGLIFDIHGFRPDAPFVVNRIWVDKPGPSNSGSNLPRLFSRAFRRYLLWRVWRSCFFGIGTLKRRT
ncbi:MAG: polysaccharide deacetylase family protein [Pseudomonadota bacterium]